MTAKIVHDAAKGGIPVKETRTVTRADGSQEITVTEKVSQPDWRAAALILERRFPESWGRRDSLKVEVDWRKELTISAPRKLPFSNVERNWRKPFLCLNSSVFFGIISPISG